MGDNAAEETAAASHNDGAGDMQIVSLAATPRQLGAVTASAAPLAKEKSSSSTTSRYDKERISHLFHKHDENDSGKLSLDELENVLKDLQLLGSSGGGADADSEMDQILRDHFVEIADRNEDGALSFDELWDGLQAWDRPRIKLLAAATTLSERKCFDFARFEPILFLAVANFLAALWEDVFDRTQADIEDGITDDPTVWFDVAASTIHLVLALLMTTLLRFTCSKIAFPRTRALTIKSLHILQGWAAKGLVAYVATALQSELTQTATISYCEAWVPPTCTVVVLGWAIVVSVLGALTAFLPSGTPSTKLSGRSLLLHCCALLAGSAPLPIGYSWHIVADDLFRFLTLHVFTSECDDHVPGEPPKNALTGPGRPGGPRPGGVLRQRALSETSYDKFDSAVTEWLVHSLFELIYALLALLLFATLKRQIKKRLAKATAGASKSKESDAAKSRRTRVVEMVRTHSSMTFDFVIAWAIFDVVAALYTSIGSSFCFPSHGGELELEKWSTLMVYMILLVLLGLLRATNLSSVGLGGCEGCCRGPATLCGYETPALAWGIALNTLGIQIGWSLHGTYAGIEDYFIDDDSAEHATAVLLLIAAITTILAILGFFVLSEWRKRTSTKVAPDAKLY